MGKKDWRTMRLKKPIELKKGNYNLAIPSERKLPAISQFYQKTITLWRGNPTTAFVCQRWVDRMRNDTVILRVDRDKLWDDDLTRQLYVASFFSAVGSFSDTATLKLDRSTYEEIVQRFKKQA